jgi:DNA-binding transcriptional ArsR family regulator
MASADTVEASVLKALGHPLRMRLLTFVTERGEASPVEMSRAFDVPLATVSHHTRVLRDLGYIELSRTEPRRGAVEHYYRALAAPFLDDEHWDMLPIPARRRVSAQLLRQVFKDAAAAGQIGGFDAASAHIARLMLDLDARGWRELSRAVLMLLRRAEAIQARSDARRDGERVEADHSCPSELAILHFAVAEPASSRAPEFRRRARRPRLP